MVDKILRTQPLAEYGVKKYTTFRSRLLAAKNQKLNSVQQENVGS